MVIASVRNEYRLHHELMEPSYTYIGIALAFEEDPSNSGDSHGSAGLISVQSQAQLMILLAESKTKQSTMKTMENITTNSS